MLKINEQSVKSGLAPNVYIRKIKISEAPGSFTKTNNLTDNTRKPTPVLNRIDGSLSYGAPNNQEDEELQGTPLNVHIDLSVVAIDNKNNKKLNWIDDSRARSPMIIKVVQSSNVKLTQDLLSNGGRKFFDQNNGEVFNKYNKFIDYQIQEISLSSRANEEPGIVKQKNALSKSNILSLVKSVKFDVQKNPKHLTYFVLCQIGDSPNASPLIPHSPVIVENVIRNSNIVKEAFKFIDPSNGAIWASSVHYHEPTGWMEGSFHTNKPHKKLIKRPEKNTKIIYQPIVDKFSNLDINLSSNTIDTPINYFSDLYITRDKDGNALFGFNFDHLNFMINNSNFNNLFKNSDSKVVSELLAASPIIDLSINRDRVRTHMASNRLQTPAKRIVDFNVEEGPDVIASSYDDLGTLKPNVKYYFEGEKSYNNARLVFSGDEVPDGFKPYGEIQEVPISNNHFRMFSGRDLSVSEKTDGIYQYSVSMQIKDGTKQFIQNKLAELHFSISNVEDYLGRASFSKNYNYGTDKFEQSFISSEFDSSKYLILPANSLQDIYSGIQKTKGPTTVQDWFSAIVKYIEILDLIFDVGDNDKVSLTNVLYSMVSPTTATLDSIQEFINVLKLLYSKIEHAIVDPYGSHSKDRSSISGGGSYPIYKTSYNFVDLYDSNVVKNSGVDYLGAQPSRGFASVSRQEFVSRIQREYERIANDTMSESEIKKNFKFLTDKNVKALFGSDTKGSDIAPAFIDLDGKRVNLLSQNVDSLDYVSATAVAQNLLFDNAAGSLFVGTSDEVLSVLDQVGKGSSAKRTKAIKDIQNKTSKTLGFSVKDANMKNQINAGTVSSEKYLGTNNKFTSTKPAADIISVKLEKTDQETAISVVNRVLEILNVSPNLQSFVDKNDSTNISFDLSKENNFLSKNIIPSKQSDDLKKSAEQINDFIKNEIPHQQKLLTLKKDRLYNDSAAKASSDDDVKSDGFIYNFGMLRRVEYLSGFKNNSIKDEIWKKLTFQNIASTAGTLLCRIKKYDEPLLNIGSYELVNSLPVYNEYFTITLNGDSAGMNSRQAATQTGLSYTDNTQLLYNGTQRGVIDELLRLTSLEFNTNGEVQYLMTQIPRAPTSAFRRTTGIGKAKNITNQSSQVEQRADAPRSGASGAPVSRSSTRGRRITRSSGGSY